MLELPESYTISKQIEQALVGKIISAVDILHTPHRFAFFIGDSDKFCDYLEGQTITGATYHGGMIEIDTEDSIIAFADGARPQYYTDKNKFPRKHQFVIYFDDDTAIFVAIQMYGEIFIYPQGKCNEGYYVSSSTKPSPLAEEFTFDYFKSLYPGKDRKLTAKAFLATQQRIPGLGNGTLQDILWDAGLDPRFDMSDMTDSDWMGLYSSVRNIMRKMCECGGRDTENDLFGNKGGYITQLSKNSLNEPCIKCGTLIRKTNYMGGTVYFCEQCQKR